MTDVNIVPMWCRFLLSPRWLSTSSSPVSRDYKPQDTWRGESTDLKLNFKSDLCNDNCFQSSVKIHFPYQDTFSILPSSDARLQFLTAGQDCLYHHSGSTVFYFIIISVRVSNIMCVSVFVSLSSRDLSSRWRSDSFKGWMFSLVKTPVLDSDQGEK